MHWKTVPEYELSVLARVRTGELSQKEAAVLLGRSRTFVQYQINPVFRERQRKWSRERNRERYRTDPVYRERELARKRVRDLKRYWALSGFEYNEKLLQNRRWKALKRMAERNELANRS